VCKYYPGAIVERAEHYRILSTPAVWKVYGSADNTEPFQLALA